MAQELFTIQDIIRITKVSQNTLYRYIRQGKIKTCKTIKSGKQVITIEKQELERFLGHSLKVDTTNGSIDTISGKQDTINGSIDTINDKQGDKTLTKSDIKELFQDLIQEQNTLIMKPLEEQSLYRLGRIEQENIFLKAKVETLLQELEQYKSLPGAAQIEEKEKALMVIQGKYEEQIQRVTDLQQEKEDLLSRAETIQKEKEEQIRKAEGLNQVLLDNANNITKLAKEKDSFQSALKEQEATIREKERALKDLEELHRAELEQVLKQAEKKQIEISEAWKKELELAKRPWWKFW